MRIPTPLLAAHPAQHLTRAARFVVAALLLCLPGPVRAAEPVTSVQPSAVVRLAGERVGDHALVTTGAGVTVAIWERATARHTRILTTVRSGVADWQAPQVLASWQREDVDRPRGNPRLVLGKAGSVVAVWVSPEDRIVSATWRKNAGWGAPEQLSRKHEVARGPAIASNDPGQLAVTWQRPTPDRGILVRAAVKLGTRWVRSTVGRAGPRGLGVHPPVVGIDDAGNVTVAWYRLRPKPPHSGDGLEVSQDRSLASRLAAGAALWEAPHPFGPWEPYFDDEPFAPLVVEDDGTAWVADWVGGFREPQRGPMWRRDGAGDWVGDERAPYANEFVTNDAGELISWGSDAGPHGADAVNTRQSDGSWTSADFLATTVVLDDAGDAAAIGVTSNTLWVRIRDAAGVWGPEEVLVENATRQNDRSRVPVISASIDPDGTVTLLWRTYANDFAGDHPEHGPDLRSVRFSAMVPGA